MEVSALGLGVCTMVRPALLGLKWIVEARSKLADHSWFHVPWQIIVAGLCTYWYWHPPTPNKAVLVLTGVTVFMALLEMRTSHKAVYLILVLCLMFIENRAINKDRADATTAEEERRKEERAEFKHIGTGIESAVQQSQQQFQVTVQQSQDQFNATLRAEKSNLAQTLGGLKETVNAATGGEGFCYALVIPPGSVTANSPGLASIIPKGKYPLTNVNALVTDDDMVIQRLNDASKDPAHSGQEFADTMQRAQEWIHIGDLPPNFSEQLSMRAASVPVQDRRMVSIFFYANNGNWNEKFALRRVNGQWLRLIRVWRQRLDLKKKTTVADMIFEQIDPGFPEDTNTKASTALSASPPH